MVWEGKRYGRANRANVMFVLAVLARALVPMPSVLHPCGGSGDRLQDGPGNPLRYDNHKLIFLLV